MKTLREYGLTESSLDNTVNPETLDEDVEAVVTYECESRVFLVDGQLIFAPINSHVFWDAQEPSLEDLLAGKVDRWEPNEITKVEKFCITHHINARGLARIREFLDDNHKEAADITDDMLLAWASPAEDAMDGGQSPSIEIASWYTILGATATLSLSLTDFDVQVTPCE